MRKNVSRNVNGKKSLGSPRRRWEDDIILDLKQDVKVWTGLTLPG
jgi:hypothetical protein